MRFWIFRKLNFAIGLTFAVFGFAMLFTTDNIFSLMIAIVMSIFGLYQLSKSKFIVEKH